MGNGPSTNQSQSYSYSANNNGFQTQVQSTNCGWNNPFCSTSTFTQTGSHAPALGPALAVGGMVAALILTLLILTVINRRRATMVKAKRLETIEGVGNKLLMLSNLSSSGNIPTSELEFTGIYTV